MQAVDVLLLARDHNFGRIARDRLRMTAPAEATGRLAG
jgi:hypothetical protein